MIISELASMTWKRWRLTVVLQRKKRLERLEIAKTMTTERMIVTLLLVERQRHCNRLPQTILMQRVPLVMSAIRCFLSAECQPLLALKMSQTPLTETIIHKNSIGRQKCKLMRHLNGSILGPLQKDP